MFVYIASYLRMCCRCFSSSGLEQEKEKDTEDKGVLILQQEEDDIKYDYGKLRSLYNKCSNPPPLKMVTDSNVRPLSNDEQLEDFRLFSKNLRPDGNLR